MLLRSIPLPHKLLYLALLRPPLPARYLQPVQHLLQQPLPSAAAVWCVSNRETGALPGQLLLRESPVSKNKTHPPPVCPYCDRKAVLVDDGTVYARSYGSYVWLCKPCQAWVGVHRNSSSHVPLGRLANADLRRLKIKAHALFDSLWRAAMHHRGWSKSRARMLAYRWLATELEIQVKKCHIGYMDETDTCRVIRLCQAVINKKHTPANDACKSDGARIESSTKADVDEPVLLEK